MIFLPLLALGHNTAEYIHVVSEAVKLAYSECWNYLCDPVCNHDFKSLLSEDVAHRLKLKIDEHKLVTFFLYKTIFPLNIIKNKCL